MRSIKEFPGISGEDIKGAALSDDNDFRLGMGEIGKCVTLLWRGNIEGILGGGDVSRLATRLAGMAEENVGKTAGDDRDEISDKEGRMGGVCNEVA